MIATVSLHFSLWVFLIEICVFWVITEELMLATLLFHSSLYSLILTGGSHINTCRIETSVRWWRACFEWPRPLFSCQIRALAVWFLVQLLVKVQYGKEQMMVPVVGTLPPMWAIQTESLPLVLTFLALAFVDSSGTNNVWDTFLCISLCHSPFLSN